MSVLSALSNSITETLGTITSVAKAANESVEIVTNKVHNRAIASKIVDQDSVRSQTAETLQNIRSKLDKDKGLKEIYNELETMFD